MGTDLPPEMVKLGPKPPGCSNTKPASGLQCDCPLCREMRGETPDPKASHVRGVPVGSPSPPEPKPLLADMISDFHLALQSVARVTAMGNEKHGPLGGWRWVPGFKKEYQNKKARHAIAGLVDDGGLDEESGLPHLAHEAWNALALLQFALESGSGSGGDPS